MTKNGLLFMGPLVYIFYIGSRPGSWAASDGSTTEGVSAAMSACQRSLSWDSALQLFAEMPGAALVPDVISFNTTISACALEV